MKPDAYESHLAHLAVEARRLADLVAGGPLDAAVAACPGWDVRRLAVHVGVVHRWATFAVVNGRAAGEGDVEAPAEGIDGAELAAWLRAGADVLVDALATSDPHADTWHPFAAPHEMWVWARRQAQETAMHRWDAETATSGSAALDAELAGDGIDEYFEVGVPRIVHREHVAVPTPSLHVHCTDVAGEWIVWNDDGEYRMEREHRKGDAALRGTAEALLLVLMKRADRSAVELVGDEAAADAWLSLPGW